MICDTVERKDGSMQRSSDKAYSILHEAGWSVGDVALDDPETGKKTWLVYCHRNGIEIVGKASTQDGAWIDAVRLAENVENGVSSTDEYSDFLDYLDEHFCGFTGS